MTKVLVVGARARLGRAVVAGLLKAGCTVTATTRSPTLEALAADLPTGAQAAALDLSAPHTAAPLLAACDIAIFLPILTLSSPALPDGFDKPCVFFSSNNVSIDPNASVYKALLDAEQFVLARASRATILRPTMIYGHAQDKNLSQLMGSIKKRGGAIVAGAKAKQRPIYFEDLAQICVQRALAQDQTGKRVAICGPDEVTQLALYRAVADAAGKNAKLLPLPIHLAAPLVGCAQKLGLKLPLSAAQLARANADRLPKGDLVVTGRTPLVSGLKMLAQELNGT